MYRCSYASNTDERLRSCRVSVTLNLTAVQVTGRGCWRKGPHSSSMCAAPTSIA